METVLAIIIGVIILTIIVVIHELGHALAAKRAGVGVEEFGVGFPPRAWGKKVTKSLLGKNVVYSVNWLPLGGFVKLQGEHDADAKKGDFGKATFWQKTQIMFAGVAMNWVTAVVLFTLLAPFGIPKIVDNQFSVASDTTTVREQTVFNYIANDMPASQAGIKTGDALIALNGQTVNESSQLSAFTKAHKGETVQITYRHDGTEKTADVALRADNSDQKGYLGASTYQREMLRSTWSAPIVGVGLTVQLTGLTFQGIGDAIANLAKGAVMSLSGSAQTRDQGGAALNAAGANVSGPVGLIGVILPGLVKEGPTYIVLIAAVISLSLAAINVLPIPALDGGRWFVIAVYKALRRPLNPVVEERIATYGFMVLIGLIVLTTIADVKKFF